MSTFSFLDAMNRRYACKLFDTDHDIAPEQINLLLEFGRLSPSSFGLEHWHFFAVVSPLKKKELYSACFNQEVVGSASLGLVIASRRGCWFDPDGEYVAKQGSRFPGLLSDYIEDYRGYYTWLRENGLLDSWSRAQCYIACANMLTGAATLGIDSCAIEGFNNDLILDMLDLDQSLWQTGIVCVFGKAAGSGNRDKIRMNPGEVYTYV